MGRVSSGTLIENAVLEGLYEANECSITVMEFSDDERAAMLEFES